MKIKTFYKIFYKHRFDKAKILRKIYLLIIFPIKYLFNYFYLEKKKNLDNFSLKNSFLFKKDLNYLFEYFNSDKGEFFINQYVHPAKKDNVKIQAHGYSKFYEKIFNELRELNMNILEIGSFYGNASAALFFYFKKAKIFGADINPDMFRYTASRINSFYVNSSLEESLINEILKKKIEFKIIIEDASHMLKDQIISLFYLFPILQKGGYFIIEELDFPEKRLDMRLGQKFPDLKSILLAVKSNKDFNSIYINKDLKDYFIKNIDFIEIYKGNFNEMAILKKK